jgi:hypothetical protein
VSPFCVVCGIECCQQQCAPGVCTRHPSCMSAQTPIIWCWALLYEVLLVLPAVLCCKIVAACEEALVRTMHQLVRTIGQTQIRGSSSSNSKGRRGGS